MNSTAELRMLCDQHGTIPTSYKLEGVVREGDNPQRTFRVVETWKGRYKDEVVALKILKVSRRDPHMLAFKRVSIPRNHPGGVVRRCPDMRQRLFVGMVLMKQLEHANILPFYGVSTTVADFCLVSPWCNKPDVNRFDLASLFGRTSYP